jgi:predicted phosphodiesterase
MHEPDRLQEFLESGKFGTIIFGHTHKPENRVIGRTLVVNPGETGGWLSGKCTIAMLKLPEKEFTIISL